MGGRGSADQYGQNSGGMSNGGGMGSGGFQNQRQNIAMQNNPQMNMGPGSD